jgi:uracil-DNA glycosylase
MSPRSSTSAADYLPAGRLTLPKLRRAADGCRGCDLWEHATQTVFGEGAGKAKVILVGEQPGDQEDLQGHPFVGPAGKLLDRALGEAQIDRGEVYVTNAVKHFRWVLRGKRRLHQKPTLTQVRACRPWLEAEVGALAPEVIVALGATAAQALMGPKFRLTAERGRFHAPDAWAPAQVLATVHPSAILRAPSDEDRRSALAAFVRDLARVRRRMAG